MGDGPERLLHHTRAHRVGRGESHAEVAELVTRPLIIFFFQAEDGIRDYKVTGVQTCALPISHDVHYGLAAAKREQRARVLTDAFARHPRRFPNGAPRPKDVPSAAWINPPKDRDRKSVV